MNVKIGKKVNVHKEPRDTFEITMELVSDFSSDAFHNEVVLHIPHIMKSGLPDFLKALSYAKNGNLGLITKYCNNSNYKLSTSEIEPSECFKFHWPMSLDDQPFELIGYNIFYWSETCQKYNVDVEYDKPIENTPIDLDEVFDELKQFNDKANK